MTGHPRKQAVRQTDKRKDERVEYWLSTFIVKNHDRSGTLTKIV